MNFNCRYCRKKHSQEDNLFKHIEKDHPFVAELTNRQKLDFNDRHQLLHQFEKYSQFLDSCAILFAKISDVEIENAIEQYLSWNGKDVINKFVVFVWVSHMLIPQNFEKASAAKSLPRALENWFDNAPDFFTIENVFFPSTHLSNELKRMVKLHLIFCQRAVSSQLLKKSVSNAQQLDSLFDDFERFLNLGLTWKFDNFCPSLPIDLIWHASMTNHDNYNTLCRKFIGRILPHCLEENDASQSARYNSFLRQFNHQHGREPIRIADMKVCDHANNDSVFDSLRQQYVQEEAEIAQKMQMEEARLLAERIAEEQRREQQRQLEILEHKRQLAIEKARKDAELRAYRLMTPRQRQEYDLQKQKEEEAKKITTYTSREDSQC